MSAAHHSDRYLSRELSWLAFNQRVLDEATNASTPMAERAKFAAIVASNLDEFFMVRVAGLEHQVADDDTAPDLAGLTPAEQLTAISERVHRMVDTLYRTVNQEILPAIAADGARVLDWTDLDPERRRGLDAHFRQAILPILTPLAIDASRPFPLLASSSLNLVLCLASAVEGGSGRLAIVQVPSGLQRLLPAGLPGTFVLLEQVILAHASQLFPGQLINEAVVIRLARDAEIELDDEGGRTQLEAVERELRRRRRSDVVRLEISASVSDGLLAQLMDILDLSAEAVYRIRGPLDLRFLMTLIETPGLTAPRDPPYQPVDALADTHDANLFAILDERSILLHHPYDAYDPVIALLAQAADDPDVLAIKQTLYRTSAGSALIASLQRAAERNKQVTVLVEVTARFDEERNIQWARALEEAGAHVIYGVRGYKTHAKICLIVRRGPNGLTRYLHLGTGNYNERTARTYTDFGLMTASPALSEDATAFFNAVTGYSDPPRLKKLVMAPTGLRSRFLKMIDREQRRATAGQPAEITAKMNSLTDREIVDALYAAAAAGVRIRLNVRGICVLRPGVPGLSENIDVVSIVDRYLEHARIYYFLNGGADELYMASADWMTRNLDTRIELMFPIDEPDHRARVLAVLRAMFRDTVKARWLGADGEYRPRPAAPGEAPFRVQQYLQDEARRRSVVARDRSGVTFVPRRG